MRKAFVLLGFVVAFSLTIDTRAAYADPVTITGGTLVGYSNQTDSFRLTGDNFLLTGSTEFGIGGGALLQCSPCSADRPVTLSFIASPGAPGGPALVANGVTYAYPNATVSSQFFFTSPNFSSSVLSPTNLAISEPFSMTATVSAYQGPFQQNTGPLLFTTALVGSGIATGQFIMDPSGPGQPQLYEARTVTYDFSAAPTSPTPEPASLALLGAGFVGVFARRRRTVR